METDAAKWEIYAGFLFSTCRLIGSFALLTYLIDSDMSCSF